VLRLGRTRRHTAGARHVIAIRAIAGVAPSRSAQRSNGAFGVAPTLGARARPRSAQLAAGDHRMGLGPEAGGELGGERVGGSAVARAGRRDRPVQLGLREADDGRERDEGEQERADRGSSRGPDSGPRR
jgi:hypothetical protein